jgi:type II secretory pathway component GspD/PulD (secretin)
MTARRTRALVALVTALLAPLGATPAGGPPIELTRAGDDRVTVIVRDAPVAEVFEMFARKQRVNIVLGEEIEGAVSVNLFEVTPDRAIRAIADAAGYVAEQRHGTWAIIEREEAGKDSAAGNTRIRAFKVEYSDPESASQIIDKHLSRYGRVTVLADRRLLIVEDLPGFLQRIELLLAEIDREPSLIFIEARILEITLDEDEEIGIDWRATWDNGSVGLRDLGIPGSGFFFDLMTSDLEIKLRALNQKGRVRTLSTPTLLAVEHEQAEVVIGDRLGFKVTTTINQVTTESVEFLESGVILRFTASVDRSGRIVLDIHPEVSNGTIEDGLPQQRTTEVTTRLRTDSGQTVFIAGLLRDSETDERTGIPFFMDLPLLGRAFTRTKTQDLNRETVVLLSARIVDPDARQVHLEEKRRARRAEESLRRSREERSRRILPVDPLTESLGGVPFGDQQWNFIGPLEESVVPADGLDHGGDL